MSLFIFYRVFLFVLVMFFEENLMKQSKMFFVFFLSNLSCQGRMKSDFFEEKKKIQRREKPKQK